MDGVKSLMKQETRLLFAPGRSGGPGKSRQPILAGAGPTAHTNETSLSARREQPRGRGRKAAEYGLVTTRGDGDVHWRRAPPWGGKRGGRGPMMICGQGPNSALRDARRPIPLCAASSALTFV